MPVDSGTQSNAAIDTGTTLAAGPEDQIASIYAQIPDSEVGTAYLIIIDNLQYRCGGHSVIRRAFLGEQSGGLPFRAVWIVGDTFLKNVYSVFRYKPPSVGFASLSDYSLSLNGNINLGAPSPTIGSVSAAAAAGSNDRHASSAAASRPSSLILTIAMTFQLFA
ncbi:hypothetical protein C8R44DRAFT_873222 [Mycena epipterygia]|nr:hypothetical protein C8R44DRAFT_873222 [Mycena epipterygia]